MHFGNHFTMPDMMRTGVLPGFNLRKPLANLDPAVIERLVKDDYGTLCGGTLRGADESGRPLREFALPGMPTSNAAARAGQTISRAAVLLRRRGLLTAPAIVAGPAAALARGEAVVLRFTNGVAITAAL